MSADTDYKLRIYTITDHPSDFPDKFAVRRAEIVQGASIIDPDFLILTDTLETAREQMFAMGLVCLGRSPKDDKVIVESWI